MVRRINQFNQKITKFESAVSTVSTVSGTVERIKVSSQQVSTPKMTQDRANTPRKSMSSKDRFSNILGSTNVFSNSHQKAKTPILRNGKRTPYITNQGAVGGDLMIQSDNLHLPSINSQSNLCNLNGDGGLKAQNTYAKRPSFK